MEIVGRAVRVYWLPHKKGRKNPENLCFYYEGWGQDRVDLVGSNMSGYKKIQHVHIIFN